MTPAVVEAIARLRALALTPTEKGHAQFGAYRAALHCIAAGWRQHAERLRDALFGAGDAAAAIEAIRAGLEPAGDSAAGRRGGAPFLEAILPALAPACRKLRDADVAAVDAAWAAALVCAGHPIEGDRALGLALADVAKVRRGIHVRPRHLLHAVRAADALPTPARRAHWIAACETTGYLSPHYDLRADARAVGAALVDDELPWLAEVVAGTAVPAPVREALADVLVEQIAERADTGLPLLLDLVERPPIRPVALRAARGAARHLARRGQLAEARAVARAAGLPIP